jgi:hypothetical protein
VSVVRKASTRNQTHVSRSDNGNFHSGLLLTLTGFFRIESSRDFSEKAKKNLNFPHNFSNDFIEK